MVLLSYIPKPTESRSNGCFHNVSFPSTVTSSQKETALRWKFIHYDRNEDNSLNSAEEFIFHRELFDFYGCASFFDHLEMLLDDSDDNRISQQEWSAFFEIPSGTKYSTCG